MVRTYIFKSTKQSDRRIERGGRPYDVQELIECFYSNAYHAACVKIKTICILGDGIVDESINKKLQEIVRKDSIFTLLNKTILDLRIFGDAFWEIVRTGNSVEIYYMPSWTMSEGKEGGWIQSVGGKKVEFSDDQVWHFYEPNMLSQLWGAPDYMQIVESVQLYSTIRTYNKNFFVNNAIPDSIIFLKGGDISPSTESGIRKFFRDKFRGVENAAKFCIAPLPEGVDVQLEKLQDTKDGKFLELKDSLITEISACHGVPPRLISILVAGKLGGAGEAEGELKIFLATQIKPMQNILGGQLDAFFKDVLNIQTDITFKAFDLTPSAGATALDTLRQLGL